MIRPVTAWLHRRVLEAVTRLPVRAYPGLPPDVQEAAISAVRVELQNQAAYWAQLDYCHQMAREVVKRARFDRNLLLPLGYDLEEERKDARFPGPAIRRLVKLHQGKRAFAIEAFPPDRLGWRAWGRPRRVLRRVDMNWFLHDLSTGLITKVEAIAARENERVELLRPASRPQTEEAHLLLRPARGQDTDADGTALLRATSQERETRNA